MYLSSLCISFVFCGFKGILSLRALWSGRSPTAQSQILLVIPVACHDTYVTTRERAPRAVIPKSALSPLSSHPSALCCGMARTPLRRQLLPLGATSRFLSRDVIRCLPDVTPHLSGRPGPKASLDVPLGAGCSSRSLKAAQRPHGLGRTGAPGTASPFSHCLAGG